MKIALVTPNFIPLNGGTQIAVYNIAKSLAIKGHKIVLITRATEENHNIKLFEDIPVCAFKTYSNRLSFIHTNLFLYRFLKENLIDVDIVHQFHLLRFGLPVVLFSRNYSKPVITSLMGTDTFNPLKDRSKYISWYLSYVMNNSTIVTSPSKNLASYAYNQGCTKEIRIIPHGIDSNYFKYRGPVAEGLAKILLNKNSNRKIILAVQRLYLIKKVDILIKAVSLLVNKYGNRNVLLIIIGDGPERANLVKLANDLNVSHYIEFHGHINHDYLSGYYHCCDIFAFHSTYEAFGIVLAEAMAAGKPVVSTFAGAIPEVVEHNETGILVPPNDPDNFAKALKVLVENEPLAKMMGGKGRNKAMLMYGWGDICNQYLQLYNTLMETRIARRLFQ